MNRKDDALRFWGLGSNLDLWRGCRNGIQGRSGESDGKEAKDQLFYDGVRSGIVTWWLQRTRTGLWGTSY